MTGPATRAVACLVALAAGLVSPRAQAEDLTVGLILPFSGVYASLGEYIENGFNLGLEHFGGDLEGHTISIVRADTETDPATGLALTRRLVLQDRVDVLVGVVSSAVLGGIRDFVHGSGVPLIVANAGNNDMTGPRCSPNIIRLSFSNAMINRPMGAWVADQGVERVFVMAPDYAAGHQMIGAFTETFTAAGGEVIGEAYPPLAGTLDYAPFLAAAGESGADAVYAFFGGSAAITFVRQYHDFGLGGELPLYGPGFLASPAHAHVQGESIDGLVGALHYVPSIDTPENRRFQEGYQAAYGTLGSEYAVAGYDAAHLIVQALQSSDGDRDAFAAALRQADFVGPRGPLEIDPATNNVIQNIYIFRTNVRVGAVAYEVLDVVERVQDPPNGCEM